MTDVSITEQLGITAAVVDAIDDRAAAFYRKFGFRPLGEPADRRLFLLIKDAMKILGPPEENRPGST